MNVEGRDRILDRETFKEVSCSIELVCCCLSVLSWEACLSQRTATRPLEPIIEVDRVKCPLLKHLAAATST